MYLSLVLQVYVPLWSTTHLTATHTNSLTTSNWDTNIQLLDFDTAAQAIEVPVQDTDSALPAAHNQARAQLPQLVFRNWPNTHHPPPSRCLLQHHRICPIFSAVNATLAVCHSPTPTFKASVNPFEALSITIDNDEDCNEALTSLSLSPTSTASL